MKSAFRYLRFTLVLLIFLFQAWWLTVLLLISFTDKFSLMFSATQPKMEGKTLEEVSEYFGRPDSIVVKTEEDDRAEPAFLSDLRWIYIMGISPPLNELTLDVEGGKVSHVGYSMFPKSRTQNTLQIATIGLVVIVLCFIASHKSARMVALMKSVLLGQVEVIVSPYLFLTSLAIATILLMIVSWYYYFDAVFSFSGRENQP